MGSNLKQTTDGGRIMARSRARGGTPANHGGTHLPVPLAPEQLDPHAADPDTAARAEHDPVQPRRRRGKGPFLLAIAVILLIAGALLGPRLISRLAGDESAETKTADESKKTTKGKKIPKFVTERRDAFYSDHADEPDSKWERAWGWGTGSLLGWGELADLEFEWFAWSDDEALTFEVSVPFNNEMLQGISSLGDDWTISNESWVSVITRTNWMQNFCTGEGDDLKCAYERGLYESARELRALDVFADFKVGATYD